MDNIKLMYITNRPDVAKVVEAAGVDRIFVDMEYIGKGLRQGGMDTVQSHHTVQDIRAIRSVVTRAELLVRCNPIHNASAEHGSSQEEIDEIVASGADIIMLPYFRSAAEVETFLKLVGGRIRTMLLFEHQDAVDNIDEILALPGFDEVYIGLNDLSLSRGQKFMFAPLADGTVDKIAAKFRAKGLPFGFGGIASLGKGMVPSEYIIKEHYRLGSRCAILSRSFCNVEKVSGLEELSEIFNSGISQIRQLEAACQTDAFDFQENHRQFCGKVEAVLASMG